MTRQTLNLNDALYAYLTDVLVREPDLLARLRRETGERPDGMMQIAPEQGQFLSLLIRLMGARRALEVGVFTGYSSLCVALALPEDGELTALDINPATTAIARAYWAEAGVAERVDLRLGDATASLDALLADGGEESYDFAFIDADKEGYEGYFERCLALIRPGGLIAVDNVLWSGRVVDPDTTDSSTRAIQAFNRRRHGDDRVDISLVPIADGVLLAHKRLVQ